jgi:hypothetical protein
MGNNASATDPAQPTAPPAGGSGAGREGPAPGRTGVSALAARKPDDGARSGKAARWVILGSLTLGCLIGTWVYFSASRASIAVWDEIETFGTRGKALSGPACVSASLDWFRDTCAAPGRICLDAVPRAVSHCLAAADRAADCQALGNDEKPSQWAYERCAERGIDRKARKPIKESCTSAWRAFDTYCKSGQRGVAL